MGTFLMGHKSELSRRMSEMKHELEWFRQVQAFVLTKLLGNDKFFEEFVQWLESASRSDKGYARYAKDMLRAMKDTNEMAEAEVEKQKVNCEHKNGWQELECIVSGIRKFECVVCQHTETRVG